MENKNGKHTWAKVLKYFIINIYIIYKTKNVAKNKLLLIISI